jgi:uncharacterized protein
LFRGSETGPGGAAGWQDNGLHGEGAARRAAPGLERLHDLRWYGHLKFTDRPLWLVVVASWGIAFIEYCFAVPANRIGHMADSAAELKTMQEVITLVVFAAFSVLYLKEALTWNHAVGFAFIALGAFFVFKGPL